MPRALLSVYDKSGIVDLASTLHELGWELLSSGGTAKVLHDAGIPKPLQVFPWLSVVPLRAEKYHVVTPSEALDFTWIQSGLVPKLFPSLEQTRRTDMQSIPGTFGPLASVPSATLRIYPDVELVAELSEYHPVHTPST